MTAKICHWPQQLFNTNCKVFPGRMLVENFLFLSGWKIKSSYLKPFSIILLVSCNRQIWKWLFSDISGICEHKKTPRWLEMILRCICNKLTILWRRWQCFDCRIVFFCCWTDFNGFYYFCKVLYFIYCHYFSIHDTCMIFRLHIFSWYFSFFVYFFFIILPTTEIDWAITQNGWYITLFMHLMWYIISLSLNRKTWI